MVSLRADIMREEAEVAAKVPCMMPHSIIDQFGRFMHATHMLCADGHPQDSKTAISKVYM